MKALVGIDVVGAWQSALDLLCRLWPKGLEVELVHCIESVFPDRSFPEVGPSHPLADIYLTQRRMGEEVLDLAAKRLSDHGVPSQKHLLIGDAVRNLIGHADSHSCDLIVLRSSVKGFWGTTLFGSTAKGVLMGAHQSVLVVKADHSGTGPVDALLATDHSPYMDRCLDLLMSSGVSGLGRITVFTANEMESGVSDLLESEQGDELQEALHWKRTRIQDRNEWIAERLAPLAAETGALVRDGSPNETIRQAMEESCAELLILGAQGHGFWERLQMGSKSFHQALSEPYSVLVLRKP